MREILFLEPVFKEMIWGGNQLRTKFGYEIPSEKTGECWAISAHKNGDCKIASGSYKGEYLSSLYKTHPELFGAREGGEFPLLVKIIDAKEDLSIQVHPDDAYAKEHENGSLGKTEGWYILDCEEDSQIVIGHHASGKRELEEMIDQGRWDDLIRLQPIKKGDFFQIEPGTVHAIKGGTLILETQQSSDITYRVYDYDRLSNGQLRELHVEKSKAVIKVPYVEQSNQVEGETLVSCPYYTVKKIEIRGERCLLQNHAFLLASVIEGKGSIDGIPLQKGSHFILPNGYGAFVVEGNMDMIVSYQE
ncbi:MAG: mannose-6-phosphate isomerase [Clostridiales bacterium]|nr:mannose-6-phosphate isomerase [Clostridiales bacterium]